MQQTVIDKLLFTTNGIATVYTTKYTIEKDLTKKEKQTNKRKQMACTYLKQSN